METLMVSALGLTISYGVFKVNEVSMYTAKVVNSELDQKDLRGTIHKALGDRETCIHNLKKSASFLPKTSIEFLETKGKSDGTNKITLIDSRSNQNLFKNSLRIQKFEFKNSKDFIIHYSKEGLGRHETLAKSDGTKGVCTKTDTTDCYSVECKIDFSCSNNDCDGSGDRCSLLDCTGGAEGGGGANCYQVDTTHGTNKAKTLVGCGGAHKAKGEKVTVLGFGAGKVNEGDNNTFLGAYAGYRNTSGDRNIFVGEVAGYNNNTGAHNTFIGVASGNRNTTGQENTFIGRGSGFKNTEASNNTFLGAWSGFENTTGFDNTFIGVSAGNKNNSNYNTFVGKKAGLNNAGGGGNTFIGERAGESNNSGYHNTFIGSGAGLTHKTGHDNIVIGRHVKLEPPLLSPTGSHQINIGNKIKIGDGFIQLCDSTRSNCLRINGPGLNCGSGKVLQGIDANGNLLCHSLHTVSFSGSCGPGQYLYGVTNTYPRNPQCRSLPSGGGTPGPPGPPGPQGPPGEAGTTAELKRKVLGNLSCPSGQIFQNRFDANGNMVCIPPEPEHPAIACQREGGEWCSRLSRCIKCTGPSERPDGASCRCRITGDR